MNKEQGVSLNVVIIPDDQTSQRAIDLSKRVSNSFPAQIVLDNKDFLPHITLYQAHYPTENLPGIKTKMEEIAIEVKPFKISLASFSLALDTYVFWHCKRSPELIHLHDRLVDSLNPLRRGLVLPHLARVTGMSEEDKLDIEKYGALLIKERYQPHITISRLSEKQELENIVKLIGNTNNVSFVANLLALGKVGEGGTLTEIVESFELG